MPDYAAKRAELAEKVDLGRKPGQGAPAAKRTRKAPAKTCLVGVE